MRWQSAGGQRQGSGSGRYAGLIESDRPFVLRLPSLARTVRVAASGCNPIAAFLVQYHPTTKEED
jgi:hypothetical protein